MRNPASAIAACVIAALTPTGASAAPCGTWRAAVEDEEGGPRMAASICIGTGEQPITLSITCSGKTFYLEYFTDPAIPYPPGGVEEFKTGMTFSDGKSRVEAVLRFQPLNATMAFNWKRSEPFTAMLKGAGPLRVEDASGTLKPVEFPLKGARAALEKLERTCGK